MMLTSFAGGRQQAAGGRRSVRLMIFAMLPFILGAGSSSCAPTREVIIYKYIYPDNKFYRNKEKGIFITPEQANGLNCVNDDVLKKVADKLQWCEANCKVAQPFSENGD